MNKGDRFKVTKSGASLSGMKPIAPYTKQGCRITLSPGDEIEYLGTGYSGGSDGIDIHKFRLVDQSQPDALYCVEFRPTASRDWWDTRPDMTFLEAI